jgi:hypothetical protein
MPVLLAASGQTLLSAAYRRLARRRSVEQAPLIVPTDAIPRDASESQAQRNDRRAIEHEAPQVSDIRYLTIKGTGQPWFTRRSSG